LAPADEYRRLSTGGWSFKGLRAAAPLEGVEITRSRDREIVDIILEAVLKLKQ